MSITSYSEMKALIARRLKRSDLTDYIPDYIGLAEARIYRELRVRAMEATLSGTISAGMISVPSGYVELKHARISGSSPVSLQRKTDEWIYANYPTRSADGQPRFIAREASNFIFGPYPDAAYTVGGLYYKRLDPLSDTNTSNWLITDAPDLLLSASMVEAYLDLKDTANAVAWDGRYQAQKEAVSLADKQEALSGSPLSVSVR